MLGRLFGHWPLSEHPSQDCSPMIGLLFAFFFDGHRTRVAEPHTVAVPLFLVIYSRAELYHAVFSFLLPLPKKHQLNWMLRFCDICRMGQDWFAYSRAPFKDSTLPQHQKITCNSCASRSHYSYRGRSRSYSYAGRNAYGSAATQYPPSSAYYSSDRYDVTLDAHATEYEPPDNITYHSAIGSPPASPTSQHSGHYRWCWSCQRNKTTWEFYRGGTPDHPVCIECAGDASPTEPKVATWKTRFCKDCNSFVDCTEFSRRSNVCNYCYGVRLLAMRADDPSLSTNETDPRTTSHEPDLFPCSDETNPRRASRAADPLPPSNGIDALDLTDNFDDPVLDIGSDSLLEEFVEWPVHDSPVPKRCLALQEEAMLTFCLCCEDYKEEWEFIRDGIVHERICNHCADSMGPSDSLTLEEEAIQTFCFCCGDSKEDWEFMRNGEVHECICNRCADSTSLS